MAYTGTDSDGGIGYVIDGAPSVREYLKQKLENVVEKVR